jgi:IS66 Orf2 like protein
MTVIGTVAPELAQAIVAALRCGGAPVNGLYLGGVKIMIATQPVDFRRGMNGLVTLVASALAADPYCGDIFVFRAALLYDRSQLHLLEWIRHDPGDEMA